MPAIAKNELGGIWHSLDGKPWRAKFREIQRKSGFAVTEPEAPEAPKSAKDVVLDELRAKKAKPEPAAAVPVNMAELQASIANLKKEVSEWQAKYESKAISLERLERSKGVAAAQVIANVPTFGSRSPIDKFNEMPDGPEKTAFYLEHQAELSRLILNPANPLNANLL